MRHPTGELLRSRVVDDVGVVLRQALDRQLTGYVVLEPQDALLFDAETRAVVTVDEGVPVCAYETTSGRGGADALAELSAPGPYHAAVYELPDASELDDPEVRVGPGVPAEQLAGDTDLAARTRDAAPDGRSLAVDDTDPVEAFLADEERIDAIRRQAREEAHARASEWGLDDALKTDTDSTPD